MIDKQSDGIEVLSIDNLKVLIEEMRINMQQTMSTGDVLDQKLITVLSVVGLILALIPTLQIRLSMNQTDFYWAVFFVATATCIVAIVRVLVGIFPEEYHGAVKSEWNEFEESFFGLQEKEVLIQILSNYVTRIEENRETNLDKAKLFSLALAMLLLATFLYLSLMPIQIFNL